jgi:hypothetical protein
MIVLARSVAALFEIVAAVRRLLLARASEVYHLNLDNAGSLDETFFSAASLAHLMEQCQNLKALRLKHIALDEDRFRMLGDFSKPGLEIKVKTRQVAGAAAKVLVHILGCDQGPTKLASCDIGKFVLGDGLRGNSRLKSLRLPTFSHSEDGNPDILVIAGASIQNKGLVDFDLRFKL